MLNWLDSASYNPFLEFQKVKIIFRVKDKTFCINFVVRSGPSMSQKVQLTQPIYLQDFLRVLSALCVCGKCLTL